jgi:hypothetical protein
MTRSGGPRRVVSGLCGHHTAEPGQCGAARIARVSTRGTRPGGGLQTGSLARCRVVAADAPSARDPSRPSGGSRRCARVGGVAYGVGHRAAVPAVLLDAHLSSPLTSGTWPAKARRASSGHERQCARGSSPDDAATFLVRLNVFWPVHFGRAQHICGATHIDQYLGLGRKAVFGEESALTR